MITSLILWGLVAFAVSFVATVFVKHLAFQGGFIDRPGHARKVHSKPTARMGGFAIYIGVTVAIVLLLFLSPTLTAGRISLMPYVGFLVGGLILMVGGLLDDRFDLPPNLSFISPVLAIVVLLVSGIGVEKLTNPFGGVIYLAPWQSHILVFVWMLAVVYTTKFLDGLDGLATSMSAVGALMILLLALTTAYFQPDVALLSAVCIGALLGFLFWNFHPASIFLGEGGSTFVGYVLGTLAIISGGKLATALLVLGIPVLDALWVIIRRWRTGGLKQIFRGDRKHLHHRLLDLGLGQRRVVFLYIFVASAFGVSTLFLQSREKLVALVLLGLMMLIAAGLLVQSEKKV
ncbi:undecaprenyl/decaprenyl-phosphate alpha-N-acetylglucosaminyl 1-phosphate transferase [Candidatus Uhrbacteria bacterium]|nr:undecaprenyl/decaprenyl-phosphate alpha-N-acetylglucosaminyl 1-phosphate transferase [Candidatus Uhrbacteria bacterium]